MVADLCRSILDTSGGRIEAINGYTRMVPTKLVQEYFGLDGVDPKSLIEWSYWAQYDAFHNYSFDLIPDDLRRHITERHEASDNQLASYMTELIAKKLILVKAQEVESALIWPLRMVRKLWRMLLGKKEQPPADGIVTRMLRTSYPETVDFDLQRLGLNAGGLLVGAVETTSQAVAQALQSSWIAVTCSQGPSAQPVKRTRRSLTASSGKPFGSYRCPLSFFERPLKITGSAREPRMRRPSPRNDRVRAYAISYVRPGGF